ncbi:PEGA domain-containing protein [Sorangium sp. So ce861]|uniref:PEGA domain-containing protein n=1 Tax=Sorangium sp. So ce861 TaxID=3133323 RepID=UPI003F5F5E54
MLLALTCAPAALAQVSDADRATARSLAVEGQEALDRKDFSAALDRFSRADAIIHAPTLLLGVARAQVGLGEWIAAQESYSRIVREGAPEKSPEQFFEAIAAAQRELDALAPRIPQVLISVRGPDTAAVTIDGEPVPRAALGVKRPVDPGDHTVRAEAAGFAPVEAKVTVAEGASETVALELKPLAPPPPVAPPRPVAPAPHPGPGAASGGSTRTVLGIAALGLGGVGLAAGAVGGVLAIGKHRDLSERCPADRCEPSLQGDVDSYHAMGTVSTIGFAIGAAGVGVGTFLLLTAPRSPQRAGISITPVIGLGSAGAKGSF